MRARIPVKYSLLMLLGGLIFALGVTFSLIFLLSGPKLGLHYDFIANFQSPPVVSREILIIDTEEFVDGNDLFTVFMTLTEMNAAALVMTGRISPTTSPITLTESEIRRRFMDEYSLIGANIRNLFEGIRMGFVTPQQAPSFVDRVVELTELGRDRLISALLDRDEDIIRAAVVFGSYFEVTTEPLYDWDGQIRRVRLFDQGYEYTRYAHPVYLNLMNRFSASHVEYTDHDSFLWLRSLDGNELDIRFDKNGNVIVPRNPVFRRMDISLFRNYEESKYLLHDIMTTANELGIFSHTLPELTPLFLAEYTFALMDELLRTPTEQNRIRWIIARTNYFNSLSDFFNSSSFENLINEYETKISNARLEDPTDNNVITNLIEEKELLIDYYAVMYEKYRRFSSVRAILEDELMMAYCIIGPYDNTLYSALVANLLITGNHIISANNRNIFFWSFILTSIVLIVTFLFRPFLQLAMGVFLSFLSAVGFGLLFFFTSYWIDPLIVLGASLCGTLLIFYCKTALLRHRVRTFRAAYGSVVPKTFLVNLIASGRPRLSEINVTYAAIVAVKNTKLMLDEARESPEDAGKVRSTFLMSVKKVLFDAGAVILSFEGDTIIACFGSPIELHPNKSSYIWSDHAKSYNPIDKASFLVRELLENPKEPSSEAWHFAVDSGECTFYWSPETGYSANGSAVVRARIMVVKTLRYKIRSLISDVVRRKINLEKEPVGSLYSRDDKIYTLD